MYPAVAESGFGSQASVTVPFAAATQVEPAYNESLAKSPALFLSFAYVRPQLDGFVWDPRTTLAGIITAQETIAGIGAQIFIAHVLQECSSRTFAFIFK
jgi:hypothetical protein